MTEADIPVGMRLKEVAGWNQTPADWRRFLKFSPGGCFVAELEGRIAGTVTTIIYENRFAWIGMVLVDPAFRGRGIGTRLIENAIEFLDKRGVPTMKLDATPQGKPVYERLGFKSEYEIERWLLRRPSHPHGSPASRPEVLDEVLKLDHQVFGASRSELLRSLASEAPAFTLATCGDDELKGYAFGRAGSRADHLGPCVAWDEPTAAALLDQFLHRSSRNMIFVDRVKPCELLAAILRPRGFELSRQLTRMVRGPNDFPGRPELQCSILGPEFG